MKEAARRIGAGAARLDLEISVGKVDARKEVVGIKPNMWVEHGKEGYHPSDIRAGRMAAWIRNYFGLGMDSTDPAYPPRKPREEESTPSAIKQLEEAMVVVEKKKLTR